MGSGFVTRLWTFSVGTGTGLIALEDAATEGTGTDAPVGRADKLAVPEPETGAFCMGRPVWFVLEPADVEFADGTVDMLATGASTGFGTFRFCTTGIVPELTGAALVWSEAETIAIPDVATVPAEVGIVLAGAKPEVFCVVKAAGVGAEID